MNFEIKVGSITNAQRAMKLLKSKNYRPSLSRIENPQPSDGCGYVVKVAASNDSIVGFLKKSGISILGVEAL